MFTIFQGEVLRQTRSLQQVSNLTYDGFLASITELNEISGHFLDANGKQLVFAVKKGSDTSFLWKGTVRVACVKIDAETKDIDSYRCLNLKQYLRVYNSLRTQSAAVRSAEKDLKTSGKNFWVLTIQFVVEIFRIGKLANYKTISVKLNS